MRDRGGGGVALKSRTIFILNDLKNNYLDIDHEFSALCANRKVLKWVSRCADSLSRPPGETTIAVLHSEPFCLLLNYIFNAGNLHTGTGTYLVKEQINNNKNWANMKLNFK